MAQAPGQEGEAPHCGQRASADRPRVARRPPPEPRTPGVERTVVVGHAMAAANAMRVAIDHPSRVAGLVAEPLVSRRVDESLQLTTA
jgi:hypothetical protein